MTDPLPTNEPATSYNTDPRPRPRRKWYAFLKTPKDLEGFYTPFWPLLIVFMSFMVLLVYEISFLRSRSMTLHMQITHLVEGVQKANGQAAFIQGLHTDLAALAPSHPAAAQILREFFPPDIATPPMPGDTSNPTPSGAGTAVPPATAPPHP